MNMEFPWAMSRTNERDKWCIIKGKTFRWEKKPPNKQQTNKTKRRKRREEN